MSTSKTRRPPWTAHAQNVAEGKSVTKKRKGKENSKLGCVFTLFICFRTFHFITVILFSVLFLLEHCECYFRWLFCLIVANFTFDRFSRNKPVWVRIGLWLSRTVVQGVIIITIALNSTAAPRRGNDLGVWWFCRHLDLQYLLVTWKTIRVKLCLPSVKYVS